MTKYIKEELEELTNSSSSIAEVLQKLNKKPCGGNYATIKHYIRKFNIDCSHFRGKAWNKGFAYNDKVCLRKLEDILQEGVKYSSSSLRNRLIAKNIKEHKCEKCGNTEWCGQPIPLELHHINGNHYDNRLENLQILCPNCHAQTENYRGSHKNDNIEDSEKRIKELAKIKELANKGEISKTKKAKIAKKERKERPKRYCVNCGKELTSSQKVYCSQECAHEYVSKRPSYLELTDRINEIGLNYTRLGKVYGVTDNAVKKWCKLYKII